MCLRIYKYLNKLKVAYPLLCFSIQTVGILFQLRAAHTSYGTLTPNQLGIGSRHSWQKIFYIVGSKHAWNGQTVLVLVCICGQRKNITSRSTWPQGVGVLIFVSSSVGLTTLRLICSFVIPWVKRPQSLAAIPFCYFFCSAYNSMFLEPQFYSSSI